MSILISIIGNLLGSLIKQKNDKMTYRRTIKKTYLVLPLFLFLAGCQNKSDVYVQYTLYENNPDIKVEKIAPVIIKEEASVNMNLL